LMISSGNVSLLSQELSVNRSIENTNTIGNEKIFIINQIVKV
jgi:hypothetical protein